MAHTPRRSGRFTSSVALILALTTLAVPAPSEATVTDEFGTLTPTYLGDPFISLGAGSTISAPGPAPGNPTAGPAAPYPAMLGGISAATVLDVNLTIHNLTSTAPGDLNLLLVGPGGQQALVMSDLGASNDVSNVSFTFDDQAFGLLGDGTISNGSAYRPQNQGGDGENFPAPAPTLDGNSALSVFAGTPANGTWSLYVVDDQTDDIHTFSWSLLFVLGTRPYPNTVQVVGRPPVNDVNVKLNGLDGDRPDDIHFLLVGPQGQQAYLMGNAGGIVEIDDVHLTFDDEATAVLPDSGQILNGSYRPLWFGDSRFFPAPAPLTTGNSSLAVFDGIDPDGEWKLFGLDDQNGETHTLDGWSLELTWEDVASPTGTVSINNGATTTAAREVTVDLTATDPEGTGVSSVRLSNDGVTFSPYQPYAASLAWTLTDGDGEKKVYAQFKDGAGNESAIVSDSITLSTAGLDTTGPRAAKLTPRKDASDVRTTVKVKVKATEALRRGSVSKQTFFLKEKGVAGKVPGKVTYRAATRTLVITPNHPLDRHTTYVVTVKRVKDVAGNAWDQKPKEAGAQKLRYSFTTG